MEWISLQNYLPLPNEPVLWYDAMFDLLMYFSLERPQEHDSDFTHFARIDRPAEYQEVYKNEPLKFYHPKRTS